MSIPDTQAARKVRAAYTNVGVLVALLVVSVAVSSFAIGRLSGMAVHRQPVTVATTTVPARQSAQTALYVGSVHSDKFHYPWCAGAQQINQDNLKTFTSRRDAQKAGYTPAQNCNGL